MSRNSVIWLHRTDTTLLEINASNEKLASALKKYTEQGGRLLLSLQAVHYLNLLGWEPEPIQDSTKRCLDDGYGRRLGVHAFREHPVFCGLNGGTYLCRPVSDVTVRVAGFFGSSIPRNGRVVAVDWDYIFLREDSKLVIEYHPGQGVVLAVGGYMNFQIQNGNRAQLNKFTANCFDYLLGKFDGTRSFYWDYSPPSVGLCRQLPQNDRLLAAIPPPLPWKIEPGSTDLKERYASGNFWDVAGERMLVMGNERGGIEEVWSHPFMALRDYEVGIRFSYRDTVYWLSDEKPEITVSPACFIRQYRFARAYLQEVITADPQAPSGCIHYEYRGVYGAELVIRFRSNLRWMWPYSERVTGSICHIWNSDLGAQVVQDRSGDLNVMIGANRKPESHDCGQYEEFIGHPGNSSFTGVPTDKLQVAGLLRYKLGMNDNLDIAFAATSEGYEATCTAYDNAIRQPRELFARAAGHIDSLFSHSLMITTPDPDFNTGYRWALAATDRFFVHTPGMGKALVAGYSTTRHGWDGGQKVNGRPGYGWYFGRDAEWSGFALLDYGDFGKVRSQLEFFNRFQDLNGKILHEASTSGLVHYDAADATPLYIVLAGKYFRHTNDTAFIRKTWPNIRRAIDFCFSTDTDHDRLIENTNVGHGWVEGGELYGSHATIYMAGAWGAAMREASNMARALGEIEAESYHLESEEQKVIINDRFWDDGSRFFAYGMNRDGSFRREPTILPAVPVYFRMADRDRASAALRQVGSNAFSSNWGVRILRDDSPLFKPSGYHYGSVWPLFTGWASLAEYSTGNPLQGYSHLMNNLNVYKTWAKGMVEEVLNGAEYKPSGVCAHQCWSETMVLQPAIEGMLGLDVKAQENTIELAPQLPVQWDSISVHNIRMADQTVGYSYKRSDSLSEFRFKFSGKKPVRVDFMPVFPAGTLFEKVLLNDREVPVTTFRSSQSMTLILSFELKENAVLKVVTSGGIAVLPAVCDPKPGDAAAGLRILSTNYKNSIFQVDVEGPVGSSGEITFWSANKPIVEVSNGRITSATGRLTRVAVDFEPGPEKYRSKTVTVKL